MKNFKNKKILVTGHTGFKGSWLVCWLIKLGAKVIGISKDIPTEPSHFNLLGIKKDIKEYYLKVEDKKKIQKIILKEKPEYIFHLAAQSLVSESFRDPYSTISTNTIGTLNILESLRKIKKKTYVVLITSDKSYKNLELNRGYNENDILGGVDPYSASKGSAEIIINSYIKSFFPKHKTKVFISIARAGNVIGGGDWSKNRLIPDFVRAISKNKKLVIRNPNSTRPWQHVIEVIYGYLLLASLLKKNKFLHGEAFNFGPTVLKKMTVIQIIKLIQLTWKKINLKLYKKKNNSFYESKLLFLNSNKAKKYLKWKCILKVSDSVKMVSEWYKSYYISKKNVYLKTSDQIKFYENLLKKKI